MFNRRPLWMSPKIYERLESFSAYWRGAKKLLHLQGIELNILLHPIHIPAYNKKSEWNVSIY